MGEKHFKGLTETGHLLPFLIPNKTFILIQTPWF